MICILYTLPSNYFQGLTNSVCNSEGSINFWREKLFFSKSGSEGINTFGREDWSFALHYNQFDKNPPLNIRNDERIHQMFFTNLFLQFFPRIFYSSSSYKRNNQEKKRKHFFSHFSGWKRNHIKYLFVKNIVDSEFSICGTIWWAH